jgi:predicted cytidylate kinase
VAQRRSVVLNGDLGSGKTTVSVLLAQRLGVRRVSVGGLYRAMAAERGMTALQLNLHAELDDEIDHYVDRLQSEIAASGERLVVDSRLAWHFFTDALKVHLVTDPTVAAQRVLGRPADDVERYATVPEARARLATRSESERMRFITRYGADKSRLRNYDLICDTTRATPDQVVERIIAQVDAPTTGPASPWCHLDPARIYPTAPPRDAVGRAPLGVGYLAPHFFAVDGQERVSAAIRAGDALVGAVLVAEAGELIGAESCADYLATRATPDRIREWEAVHGIALPPVTAASTR